MHKIFFYNKLIIRLYMFRALCALHQEVKIILYSIWYHHNCRWPSYAQVESDYGVISILPLLLLWIFLSNSFLSSFFPLLLLGCSYFLILFDHLFLSFFLPFFIFTVLSLFYFLSSFTVLFSCLSLLLFHSPVYSSEKKNVMESLHYIWGYRMIHNRQIPISMPDNAKPIVINYLLFTEVWNLKNVSFLLCTQNGAEGLSEKGG